MFKLVAVFAIVIAAANAGIIGHAAPAAYAVAPVAAHATSYQNSNSISVNPVPIAVAHAAPVAAAVAPVAAVAHAVPAIGVAAALPAVGFAHGGLLGHGGLYH
ncbi:hypothetical protein ILUMI_22947 [Ignelater luminosus]|uniref:Uncharacterized protein n=1 Tax=Ignelater luminosus TaxID=2038154 RepID=A0A8K0C925_IGNLU|nr:hypothetical protein ILUMI_22947 [Ignelater luminosus]